MNKLNFTLPVFALLLLFSWACQAHHVLGRPSYNLDEDTTTPPALELESQIAHFYVSFMAYPAIPDPHEHGRINVHISDTEQSKPYVGEVTFKARYDSYFKNGETLLGQQSIDDSVYRQGFVFEEPGNYIISAEFNENGKQYRVDMPLTVGEPGVMNSAALTITIVTLLLFAFSIYKRRQLHRLQARQYHQRQPPLER